MFKIFQKILAVIVGLIILTIVIGHPLRGGKKLGFVGDLIVQIASVPQTLRSISDNPQALDMDGTDTYLTPISSVNTPALNNYSLLYYLWPDKVVLYSFEQQQVIREYPIDADQLLQDANEIKEDFNAKKQTIGVDLTKYPKTEKANLQVAHPIIDGTDLIFHSLHASYLYRIDTSGQVVWVNKEGFYHHSLEVMDSLLYVCGIDTSSWYSKEYGYRDEAIFIINKNTGKTVDKISVSGMLDRNGLLHEILTTIDLDPIHINDIEPAPYTTAYWQKGDLGLSFRHLSFSCIYRPSADSIIWLNTTPTLAQHDIDFRDSSIVTILDNNVPNLRLYDSPPLSGKTHYSKVLEFDLASDTTIERYNQLFSTRTQGRFQQYATFSFIEETNNGIYYVVDTNNNLLSKFYIPFGDINSNKVHFANWARLYRKTPSGFVEK